MNAFPGNCPLALSKSYEILVLLLGTPLCLDSFPADINKNFSDLLIPQRLNTFHSSKESKQVALYALQANFILLSKFAVQPKQHLM